MEVVGCDDDKKGKVCVARVFFVRHGESEYNAVRRIQGWLDIPLNERGRQQAEAVASRLASEIDASRVIAVVSSPLVRAFETASFVLKALKRDDLTVKTHDGLKEIGFGPMEGTYLGALPPGVDGKANQHNLEIFRKVWKQWSDGDLTVAVPGGETPEHLINRARDAVADTLKTLFPEPKLVPVDDAPVIIFVSHGRCLSYLLSNITGLITELKNTAVSNLLWQGDDSWHLVYINDSSHVKNNAQALFAAT